MCDEDFVFADLGKQISLLMITFILDEHLLDEHFLYTTLIVVAP